MALRQRILILYLTTSCLASETCAWSEYDGTGLYPYTGDSPDEPPYWNVLEAMRDGWRVVKFCSEQMASADNAYRTGPLPFEFILEKMEEVSP